ncbi:FliG C-terminal domain-containing protein [Thalassolituus sp.]|uniref:FliG C-terminal domain-containing protein n=1 Tax=Thalassolituus sp. TaxID=2030822 RepID=UPI002A825DBA|nr:FliG C-terminal domain-containing protein [Thalassolituus sp.]
MKILSKSLLALPLLLISGLLQAEEAYEVPVKKDEVEEARFKNEMEARLGRDIQAYLGEDRFIIQVDAILERTRSFVKQEGTPAKAAPDLPSKPQVGSRISLKPVEAINPADYEELPGLPVNELPLLMENQQQMQTLQQQVRKLQQERDAVSEYADQLKEAANQGSPAIKATEKTIGYRNVIKKLTITLVVDNTLKDEQGEFLKNLITRKSQLNELRGDTLNVVRTEFNRIEPKPSVQTFWAQYGPWIWLASMLLVALLTVALFFALWRRILSGGETVNNRPLANGSVDVSAVGNNADNTMSSHADDEKAQLKYRINEARQKLVSQGLSQPHRFQQGVAQALQSAQAFEVAALSMTMGKGLFASLAPQVTPTQWRQIDDMLKEGNWSESQLLEGMEQFTERLTKQTDEHNDNAPFSFLSKLNDSQVLYLIKDEDTRIKALVMSQLPAQRAADMFLRLNEKELANVAFELGQFESLPVSAFKDVADRLARASLTVPSFENISADGLSVLIRMLDSMTMTEETRLLKTLKSEKPETYYRLRQVYFTFADLARTPDRVISNELRELDRSVLASALCHSSIEFKRHVLAALPQKLRAGVIAELKVAESENSTEVIEQARLNIVQAMRAVIRAGRFSMDELVQISQG